MKRVAYILAIATAALSVPAVAHAPHVGPAGGQTVHWGTYHFEFVPGANGSRIFVYRASDRKPLPAARMSATARLEAGGRVSNVQFRPAGGNVLASPQAKVGGDWTASVTVKVPGGAPTVRYSARELAALRRGSAS